MHAQTRVGHLGSQRLTPQQDLGRAQVEMPHSVLVKVHHATRRVTQHNELLHKCERPDGGVV